MALLTVIIPALGKPESVESTLVSVLQNRPAECQVIVTRGENYLDQYNLDDEVEFVEVAGKGSALTWMAMANAAIPSVKSPIVNVLRPGVEIPPAWFAAALRIFKNQPNVGMVSPLVRTAEGESWHGVRFESNEGRLIASSGDKNHVVGPTEFAGFFRTEVLSEIGGWDEEVSSSLGDIELAFAATELGWECQTTAQSMVWLPQGFAASAGNEKRLRADTKKIQRRYRPQIANCSVSKPSVIAAAVGAIFGSLTGSSQAAARKRFVPTDRMSTDRQSNAA